MVFCDKTAGIRRSISHPTYLVLSLRKRSSNNHRCLVAARSIRRGFCGGGAAPWHSGLRPALTTVGCKAARVGILLTLPRSFSMNFFIQSSRFIRPQTPQVQIVRTTSCSSGRRRTSVKIYLLVHLLNPTQSAISNHEASCILHVRRIRTTSAYDE